jgi:hypothetical protein
MEKLNYRIEVEGYPYQRPRLGKYGNVHNPTKYEEHKAVVAEEIRKLSIPNSAYAFMQKRFLLLKKKVGLNLN